ncbi:MMPL family transporter [Nocardioides sp.]|uniref:MMPL family transporter n=1 Tax=Nocardioides sp. TaxID=35761 RepID=UPI003516E0B9
MATLLYRLGRTAYRHWPRFIAGWLALLISVIAVAALFSKPFSDSFSIPGIPSERAQTLQQELFPGSADAFDQANVNVVVQAPEGQTLDQPKWRQVNDELVAAIQDLPQMSDDPALNPGLGDPVTVARSQYDARLQAAGVTGAPPQDLLDDFWATAPLTEDLRTGLITFAWDVDTPMDVEQASIDDLETALDRARDAGLTVEMNGPGSQTIPALGGTAELIGIGLALVVLLLTFGSMVAAGLPIISAVIGVAIGLTGVTAMTALFDLNSSTTALSSMIGLAVGIDYTLFILARYRAELRRTDDRAHAVGMAVGTAGSAVVFAGLTVLIALAALSVVGIPFLTTMGLAAAATVLIAVLVALTLLPAVLGMLKTKAFAGRVRTYEPAHDASGAVRNNGVRWARTVGRRPAAAALLVVVALGALAAPVTGLHLAFPSDSTADPATTQRQASDLMADTFGPGREGPLLIVVDARDAADPNAAFGQVADWASSQDGVANAQVVATNADPADPAAVPTGALIQVVPSAGPDSDATKALLEDLRDGESGIEAQSGTTIGTTGLTAITVDVSDRLASALPVYLAVVIGLAFVLLMIVFRSILVPLTATAGFLLSVLATLGVTVAVFQEGAFGLFSPQPIVSFMPVFLIGVVFGLAMDYQVFLVTRMREAHVHGADPREAVVDGFRSSARVVTAAAIIMISVFAGFILEHDVVVKSLGFALAVAVLFDAFVVRMVLIPALMYLLGEKAWYLPAWLDRILPNVDVEGEGLTARDHGPDGTDGTDDPGSDDQGRSASPELQPVG